MTDLHDHESQTDAEAEEPIVIPASELNEDQRTALALMGEVCAATGQDVTPVVRAVSGVYLYMDLTGEDVRMTWGRMGQSLDALQFLCNLILSRRIRSDVRMMLDADNYRAPPCRDFARTSGRTGERGQGPQRGGGIRADACPRTPHHSFRAGR